MSVVELYKRIPVERHSEVVISGDRLFFDGEEYVIRGDGELGLVHSHKGPEQKLAQIEIKLGIK